MTWRNDYYDDRIEVRPLRDSAPHDASGQCACAPRCEKLEDGRIMHVHNAWDGREHEERFEATLKDFYGIRRFE